MLDHIPYTRPVSEPVAPAKDAEGDRHPMALDAHGQGSNADGLLSPTSPWYFEDDRCMLEDLNNYIALGCIVIERESACHEEVKDWTELHTPPWVLPVPLQDSLRILLPTGRIRVFAAAGSRIVLRVYVVAFDSGRRVLTKFGNQKILRSALRQVVAALDTSSDLWRAAISDEESKLYDIWATADPRSLFWMFNNIPSPRPNAQSIPAGTRKDSLLTLLDEGARLDGLKTDLYPYQRRSAGLMLERESRGKLLLDPRLEQRHAPDGSVYYYGARDLEFFRHGRYYESPRGGILAETMGLGKTVIALALILATRHVLPLVPPVYRREQRRPTVGSLMDMCVTTAHIHAVPWQKHLAALEEAGEVNTECMRRLRDLRITYEIPQMPPRLNRPRFNRITIIPTPKTKILASTTIVVVPRNLCSQWTFEIAKHVGPGALNLLVLDNPQVPLPPAVELCRYDIILFSRGRFEQEQSHGADLQGRRMAKTPRQCCCPYIGATRTRDCTCLRIEDIYESPLEQVHFLRIIIDEGHSFASQSTAAARVAEDLVTADHRWVVSGTPAKDLLGVEMDLYTSQQSPMPLNDGAARSAILEQRKAFEHDDGAHQAARSLGALVTHFLQVKPWNSGPGQRYISWDDYIYRHEDVKKKTHTCFSGTLRRSLQSLVIKTRPEDVEQNIKLPPLSHEVVKLEPSYFDKITANLFTFVLTANAVTSERTDRDYLFHKDSAKARRQLISNLRQSAFYWTGFSTTNVLDTIGNIKRYLEKEDKTTSKQDRWMLRRCIGFGNNLLSTSRGWQNISDTHELGLFVQDWPEESAEHWTFDKINPLLTGATQLAEAQRIVQRSLVEGHNEIALAGEGIKARARAFERGREEDQAAGVSAAKTTVGSVASSSITNEPTKRRGSVQKQDGTASPSKRKRDSIADVPVTPLPADSPLSRTRLIGTASAKASYLMSRILALYKQEKILVFYTGDNSAYYLAQVLEILQIPHLIYPKSLAAATKSKYVVDFDEQPQHRVMLMDVGQAAFGLNITAASRIFFINPLCRPQLEAQAIKRAHRIGQTREVKVETLVLKGTIEEAVWERARRMSRTEHARAKALEDDSGVREVIQRATLLKLDGERRIALLEVPQVVFGRREELDSAEVGGGEDDGGGKRTKT